VLSDGGDSETKRRFHWLRGLSGQLALSYALTTVAALLIVELTAIAVVFAAVNAFLPQVVAFALEQEAAQVSPFFVHGTADRGEVGAFLNLPSGYAGNSYAQGYLAVVDAGGRVVASTGGEALPAGTDLAARSTPAAAADAARVLAGRTGPAGTFSWGADGSLVVAVPVHDGRGRVEGAVVARTRRDNGYWVSFYASYLVLPSTLLIAVFASVAGTIFGLRTARGLVRRFNRLSVAVDRWSQGDFSGTIDDRAQDEVGQLGRRLDRMASQLRDLLMARQELATLEERNRLARDLHDSVKQQVFAASMEISTARALLDRGGPAAAAEPLAEAERLAHQAQRELTALIRQLRPAALQDRTLDAALAEYAAAWSRRTGIAVEATLAPAHRLAAPVQEALFRVAQEALANVARHSGATSATVRLTVEEGTATLVVADDGRGLDAADRGRGVGLESMLERVEAVGGTFRVEGSAGAGTTVWARCPSGEAEPAWA
jgi:NarL family two-component system sensor histidine kinase LiaS